MQPEQPTRQTVMSTREVASRTSSSTVERYAPVGFLLLALALVTVALPTTLRPPADPSNEAAELSPDAPPDENQESIVAALNRGQSETAGAGEGVGAGEAVDQVASGVDPPVAPPAPVPSAHRCFGNPPRQIEDPQSPPCVPAWRGDNGGATYQGVTDSEIRIFAPIPGDDDGWVRRDVVEALETFFNNRFEFYGRQLRLIVDFRGNTGDGATQRAVAAEADEAHQVFGSTSWEWGGGPYQRELARRRLVSTMGQEVIFEDRELAPLSPYVWSYPTSANRIFAHLGEWACHRLAGKVAAHAGQELAGRDRRFGVILRPPLADTSYSLDPLLEEMERCNVTPAEIIVSTPGEEGAGGTTAEYQNIVLQMRQSGATSVFCLCPYVFTGQLWGAATNQGYFPEWLLSTFGLLDSDFGLKTWANNPQQAQHAFGLTFLPRQVPLPESPYWWAVQEVDPSIPPGNPFYMIWWEQSFYRSLLLLASGIQMAGPNLTPETFGAALRSTSFPNPDHPIMAGHVGFRDSQFSMTVDGAEWWWSTTAQSPYPQGGPGAICYLDGGKRYTKGQWPASDGPFFQPPCDSGARGVT